MTVNEYFSQTPPERIVEEYIAYCGEHGIEAREEVLEALMATRDNPELINGLQ